MVEDLTVTITIHPDGIATLPENMPDLTGIIRLLLADDAFIASVADRVRELQPPAIEPEPEAKPDPAPRPEDKPPEQYALGAYNFVDTFSRAEIYSLVWGLRTQVAQVLARADVDPAQAIVMTDRELLDLRLMGAKSLAEVKEKRRHIRKRALRLNPQTLKEAVRIVLGSTVFDDDPNLRIDDDECTVTVSASRFQKLAELLEPRRIRAHEVLVEDEILGPRAETAETSA